MAASEENRVCGSDLSVPGNYRDILQLQIHVVLNGNQSPTVSLSSFELEADDETFRLVEHFDGDANDVDHVLWSKGVTLETTLVTVTSTFV